VNPAVIRLKINIKYMRLLNAANINNERNLKKQERNLVRSCEIQEASANTGKIVFKGKLSLCLNIKLLATKTYGECTYEPRFYCPRHYL
jgi:hypothetical protein